MALAPILAHPAALLWLNAVLLFVLAAFELGIVLQGQQQAGQSSRKASIMFAECSLVMLAVNAGLFMTALLEKVSPPVLIGVGLVPAMAGLAAMAVHTSDAWMFRGVGMTSAGTGWSQATVSIELTRQAVNGAPPYDATVLLDRKQELQIYAHHQRPEYWASEMERGNEESRAHTQEKTP